MAGDLGNLVISLSADIARFQEDMGKATKTAQDSAKQMSSALSAVSDTFKMVGTAAAAAFAIMEGGKQFKEMVDASVALTTEAVKLSRTFGISTEEASGLGVALNKLGIDHETAESAALKLSRTLAQGTDKFDEYGVKVTDANGNLLPMTQIMNNVNKALLDTQSGVDRNVMAMSLYGKSWGELQTILRLTPEVLEESAKKAEALHLVIGPEGAAAIREYNESIREAKEVAEAYKKQIGDKLIPELTHLAQSFAEAGTKGINAFILTLDASLIAIHSVAGGMDLLGESISNVFRVMDGEVFTGGGMWTANAEAFAQKAMMGRYEIEKLKEEMANVMNGTPPEHSSGPAPGEHVTPGHSTGQDESQASADRAYQQYLKAFFDMNAKIQKDANDLLEQQNQIAYEWGLIDLRAYLDKKHQLSEATAKNEVDARKKELDEARKAEESTRAAYKNPEDKAGSAELSKAHEAVVKAAMAYNDALTQQSKLIVGNGDEFKKQTDDQVRGYREQQAALADLQNDFVRAAEIRRGLDDTSTVRAKLEQEAMVGNADAIAAYWATIAQEDQKTAQAAYKQAEQFQQLGIQLLELAGQYEQAARARKALMMADPNFKQLPKEVQQQKTAIADLDISKGKTQDDFSKIDTKNSIFGTGNQFDNIPKKYEEMYKKQRQIEDQYGKDSQQAHNAMWGAKVDMTRDSLGMLSSLMMKGNKDQFEAGKALAMAMAAVDGAMAFTKALASAPPPMNFVAAGLVAASVAMQEATIASQQYSGARAAGGPVTGGETYLVGEKGPELFTPGASGAITPNHALGGVTLHMPVNIDARGADQGVDQKIYSAMKQVQAQTEASIMNSMNRGGKFAVASGRLGR